jgi:methionyl-tRNA formyltransferase
MKIVFAGSPQAAVPTLRALHESEHDVVGVLTQPPRPYARKKELKGTAVYDYAYSQGIPVATPVSAAGVVQAVQGFAPDIAIVVAYGRILSQEALDAVPGGWWNVHFSRLPQWRGAAPVQHTILSGQKETGLSLFRIVKELDAGPVAARWNMSIHGSDTSGTLLSKLASQAPKVVLSFLGMSFPDDAVLEEQEGPASYAPKFPAGFGELDLRLPARDLYRHFRAVTPEPGAFVYRADTGQVVKILEAWVSAGAEKTPPGSLTKAPQGILLGTTGVPLILGRVQPAGKKPMAAEDWFRGLPETASIRVTTT